MSNRASVGAPVCFSWRTALIFFVFIFSLAGVISGAQAVTLSHYQPVLNRGLTYTCNSWSRGIPNEPDANHPDIVYIDFINEGGFITQRTVSMVLGTLHKTAYDGLGGDFSVSRNFLENSNTYSENFTPSLRLLPYTGDVGTTYESSGSLDTWLLTWSNGSSVVTQADPIAAKYTGKGKILGFNPEFSTLIGNFESYLIGIQTDRIYDYSINLSSRTYEEYRLGKGIGVLGYKEEHGFIGNSDMKQGVDCIVIDDALNFNDSKDDGDTDDCGKCAGDPIHVGTGNSLQSAVDYTHTNSALALRRIYNSRVPVRASMGYGWRHQYDHHLVLNEVALPTRRALLLRADGKVLAFNEPGAKVGAAGNWVSDADINGRLTPIYSGGSTKPTGWRYVTEKNEIETYDANGLLTKIASVNGTSLNLSYTLSATGALLNRVTDHFGKSIVLTHDVATGLLMGFSTPDGRTIAYSYDTENGLNNLTKVTYQDGKSITYRYNEQARTANTAQPHALTSILDENGVETVSWEFDAQGRAVANQKANGIDRTTVAYLAGATATTPGATKVTDAFNTSRTVNFNKILGVTKPSSMSVSSNHVIRGGDAARLYDAKGNITARNDFENHRTCYAFDAKNQETTRVEGLSGSTACPANLAAYAVPAPAAGANIGQRKVSTLWHPDWRLVTRRAEPKVVTTYVYNGQPDPTNANAVATCAPVTAKVGDKPIAVVCKKVEQETTDSTGTLSFAATATGSPRMWSYTYSQYGQLLSTEGPKTAAAAAAATAAKTTQAAGAKQ